MKLPLDAVVATFSEVGAATPAFRSLFDLVVSQFDGEPVVQSQLRRQYADAYQRAEEAHRDAQAL